MKLKNHNNTKFLDVDFDIKSVDGEGKFSGYGSIFGNVDLGGDVVVKGAFEDSIKSIEKSKRPVPVLWEHRTGEPLGFLTSMYEDDIGLKIEGKLLVDSVARAKEVYALMKAGIVTGLSIGYRTIEADQDGETGIRYLKKLDLKELSFVTFPMNEEARATDDLQSKLAAGHMPSIREFEGALRELGFSNRQATIAASKGYGALLQRESEEPMAELADGLRGLLSKLK